MFRIRITHERLTILVRLSKFMAAFEYHGSLSYGHEQVPLVGKYDWQVRRPYPQHPATTPESADSLSILTRSDASFCNVADAEQHTSPSEEGSLWIVENSEATAICGDEADAANPNEAQLAVGSAADAAACDDEQALQLAAGSDARQFCDDAESFVLRTTDFLMFDVKTLANWLVDRKLAGMTWRNILNNTTSMRGNPAGGATCLPLATLLSFDRVEDVVADTDEMAGFLVGFPKGLTCATLSLPNSFSADDNLTLKVAAVALTEKESILRVCLLAFTTLLLRDPARVLIRDNHWTAGVTVDTIREMATTISGRSPAVGGTHGVIAPTRRKDLAWEHYEEPGASVEEQNNRKRQIIIFLSTLLRQSKDGKVRPSKMKTQDWQTLRRLVRPTTLKTFILEHPSAFQYFQETETTWAFGFAAEAASSSSGRPLATATNNQVSQAASSSSAPPPPPPQPQPVRRRTFSPPPHPPPTRSPPWSPPQPVPDAPQPVSDERTRKWEWLENEEGSNNATWQHNSGWNNWQQYGNGQNDNWQDDRDWKTNDWHQQR